MSEIDSSELEALQDDWSEIALDLPSQARNSFSTIRRIVKGFEEMGLDMEQDATYELLVPGLTRKEFIQAYTYLAMLKLLDEYHESQIMSDPKGTQYDRMGSIKRLLERTAPLFEEMFAKEGLPGNISISPMTMRQLEFVRQSIADGTLDQDMRMAAAEGAKEKFRTALNCSLSSGDPSNASDIPSLLDKGRECTAAALDAIDVAKECHQPGLIPYIHTDAGWGWVPGAPEAEFSRKEVLALFNEFGIMQAQNDRDGQNNRMTGLELKL